MEDKSYLVICRESICKQYSNNLTGCGNSFGELLCFELHINNLTFKGLGDKWGISVTLVGELIYDHCKRLERMPKVKHDN